MIGFHFCRFTRGVANECQPGVLWKTCVKCGRQMGSPVPDYVPPKTIPFDQFMALLLDETETPEDEA